MRVWENFAADYRRDPVPIDEKIDAIITILAICSRVLFLSSDVKLRLFLLAFLTQFVIIESLKRKNFEIQINKYQNWDSIKVN